MTAFVGFGVEFSLGSLPIVAGTDVAELELEEQKRQADGARPPVPKPWSPFREMAR